MLRSRPDGPGKELVVKIDLAGHVALVTGAAGQLGRAMARTLAACGARVAIHYLRSETEAVRLADELRAAGHDAGTFAADVTDVDAVRRLHADIVARLGAPDILVVNALSAAAWKPILEQSPEAFANQFRTCTLQAVLLAQACVPAMIERRWGRVIMINTECAIQCFENQGAYAAAKRGMDGVARVLSREVGGHGVTVNQVAPGWTISDRDRAAGSERQPQYEERVPLRRRGTDQEIANVVAFLASDLASFITGAYIPVSGGNVMPGI
jgi:3-oxoacyl-[acyl-carrier protein] reductase